MHLRLPTGRKPTCEVNKITVYNSALPGLLLTMHKIMTNSPQGAAFHEAHTLQFTSLATR